LNTESVFIIYLHKAAVHVSIFPIFLSLDRYLKN